VDELEEMLVEHLVRREEDRRGRMDCPYDGQCFMFGLKSHPLDNVMIGIWSVTLHF
jgi:hypothetical protein